MTSTPQQKNLANDPEHAEKLAEMQALLLAEMRRLEDPWRFWYQPDDDLPPPPAPAPNGAKGKGAKGKGNAKGNGRAKANALRGTAG